MTCKYRKVNDSFIYVSQLKASFGLPFLLSGYDRRWRWRFWDRSWKCNSMAQKTIKKTRDEHKPLTCDWSYYVFWNAFLSKKKNIYSKRSVCWFLTFRIMEVFFFFVIAIVVTFISKTLRHWEHEFMNLNRYSLHRRLWIILYSSIIHKE